MPDDHYDDDQPDDDRVVTLKRDQIRALEKQAKQATEAAARAEAAERKLAFAEAGIPLNDPKLSYFIKGYDGDPTPEAIKQAAIDAGFIGTPEPSADTAPLERTNQLAAGATPENASVEAAYQEELLAARSAEEVTAVAAKYGRLVPPQ